MFRKHVAVLGVALIAAGCSEGATAPFADGGDIAAVAVHGDINDPVIVDASATGGDVKIAWTWIDEVDDWDLASFKVTRDGVDLELEIDNEKPYTPNFLVEREITDSGLADGTYYYCVEVMAKWRSGPRVAEVTHHAYSCAYVTVGEAAYSINILGGNSADLAQNRNSARFTIGYELRYGGQVVTDCTEAPSVDVITAAIAQHNCDGTTGARNLVIQNPTKGIANAFVVRFEIDELDFEFPFASK